MEVPRGDADACPDALQVEFQEVRERYSCHGEPPDKDMVAGLGPVQCVLGMGHVEPSSGSGRLGSVPQREAG